MTNDELLNSFDYIELHEERRSIKSYAIRNNVLKGNDKEILLKYGEKDLLFFNKEKKLNFRAIFHNDNDTIIEIGSGNGKESANIALNRSNYNYIALEVYLKGVIQTIREIEDNSLDNLKVMRFNAIDVLENMTKDNSVGGFHIFFPDPWEKKKHHKRRLITSSFLSLLSSKLVKNGYIYIVTDITEYADEILSISNNIPTLYNPYTGYSPHVEWRGETKFENKGLECGRKGNEIWLLKK